MAFLDFLFGKKEKTKQIPRFNPQQEGIQNMLLSGGSQALPDALSFLKNILSSDPDALQQFQAPAMRQFQQEIIPTIAERFSQLGAQKSSAFGQQLGKAGASLAENLAAQKAGLSSGAISQLAGLLGYGMQPSFESIYRPPTQGLLGGLAGSSGGALSSLLPFLL